MQRPLLELGLAAPVRLHASGRPPHIRPAKAVALLLLPGIAPDHRRPRASVQDKLWSESPPEQGTASLRTTLSELRATLSPWRSCLVAEGGWLGLDPAQVRVMLAPGPEDWELDDSPPELTARFDIADPESEDWIRKGCQAFAASLETAPPPTWRFAAKSQSILLLAPAAATST